jgi:hypothetical protein
MRQPMIVGKPALIVVDIQQGAAMPADVVGIAHMDGGQPRAGGSGRMSELASESWAQRPGRMPATSVSEELA